MTSWVSSHGPEYLIVGGEPGGAAGVSMSKKDVLLINNSLEYSDHNEGGVMATSQ